MAAEDPDRQDREWVEAARRGEVRAFEQLLDHHQSRVLRVLRLLGVRRDDREDVAQEVFVRVFRHLDSFRAGRSFGAWLYRVTVNASHDYRVRRARLGAASGGGLEGIDAADERPGPDDAVGQLELRRALEQALAMLTERERAVFVLREVEGLETREVARALGITRITVRRHLGRARSRLREVLGDEEKNPHGVERLADEPGSQG